MRTVYDPAQELQAGQAELCNGQLLPCFEKPERSRLIRARVEERKIGPIEPARLFNRAVFERVHKPNYLTFLQNAWGMWVEAYGERDALPLVWPIRGHRQIEPETIDGKLSYFSQDAGTPITAHSWQAAKASADTALTGAEIVASGERAAFALSRPPGHHAGPDHLGGYCFLNNAALAARHLQALGQRRVAVLDVDYHHGNGTQVVFYNDPSVLFVSIHAHPAQEFPHFLGYADETGAGHGEGCNLNLPLRRGASAESWFQALDKALERVAGFAPDALVVSLGVDTFKDDPISHFRLDTPDFLELGRRIERAKLPTLFVMEGGYAIDPLAENAVNVLEGFEGG